MNNISKARLQEVHPVLAAKVIQLQSILIFDFEVVQGLRSWAQQAVLYEQGRTTPGNIVTRCLPGHSWHNFGLAVDVCPDAFKDIPGFQPDWNPSHSSWKRLIETAESLGFVCGADFRTFPDNPHLQLTGRFPVNPTDEVRQLFTDGGVKAVWDETGL